MTTTVYVVNRVAEYESSRTVGVAYSIQAAREIVTEDALRDGEPARGPQEEWTWHHHPRGTSSNIVLEVQPHTFDWYEIQQHEARR